MLPDEVIEEEAEEAEEQSEQADPVETEARSMGWVPLEEFRGPKDQWRDASEFVERGKNVLPIVNSLLKKERAKTSQLETKMERLNAEWGEKLGRLERMSATALERQREQLIAQYEAKKEEAVERGDRDAYNAARDGEAKALANLDAKIDATEKQPSAAQDLPPHIREVLADWVAENPWFQSDNELNGVATAHHSKLLAEKPGLTIEQNLERVRAYVSKRYPEKFGLEEEDKPRRGSRVEGGSRSPGGGGGLYAKLPSEVKAIADKQVALYLEPGETAEKDGLKAKERWAKVYWDQPGAST